METASIIRSYDSLAVSPNVNIPWFISAKPITPAPRPSLTRSAHARASLKPGMT